MSVADPNDAMPIVEAEVELHDKLKALKLLGDHFSCWHSDLLAIVEAQRQELAELKAGLVEQLPAKRLTLGPRR